MVKYQKWVDKNCHLLTNELAIVVGATGSIGTHIVDYLLYLKAKVILGARDLNKAERLRKDMLLKYPNAKIFVEEVDVSSLASIDRFQLAIDQKYPKADIFINNAGIYHMPDGVSEDGYEIHFATNALGNYYLAKKIMFDLKSNAKMVFTGSISYRFNKVDFSDIQSTHTKNKTKLYGLTKRIMTFNTMYLKKQLESHDIAVTIAHPGICATELFGKGHSKLFMHTIYPLMKLLFHSPEKASLSIIAGLFYEVGDNEWVGPRGLGHIWGYPSVSSLQKDMANQELTEKVHDITEGMIAKHLQ